LEFIQPISSITTRPILFAAFAAILSSIDASYASKMDFSPIS